ncbi:MAG: Cof-type HAD-IIB family hydrolase [Streptococcaceae bacterium]|nr:Cof-type HAD-IIB family hydrolase [Streptococcaceae bacterium]
MTKGIAFFDLDATLLDENAKITPNTKSALNRMKENGILVVIATGRSILELSQDNILEESGIDTAIMLNGAQIMYQGEIIVNRTIPSDVITRMINLFKKEGLGLAYLTEREIFVGVKNEAIYQHFNYFHQPCFSYLEAYYLTNQINMLIIGSNDQRQDRFIIERFPELDFFRNSPHSIDVTPLGVDKAFGARELIARLKLQGVKTYAFGDGLNDLPLFKICDERVCMANGKDELKEIATLVTKSNTEDGVAYAIKQLGLI